MKRWTALFTISFFLLFVAWVSLTTYRSAFPLAEENFRGLALLLVSAIEAVRDPFLNSLKHFNPENLSYGAAVDRSGV